MTDEQKLIDKLRAENAKLRKVLDFIADTPMQWTKPQGDVYWSNMALAFAKLANDARTEEEKGDD